MGDEQANAASCRGHVLVADDDPAARASLARLLQGKGFDVAVADGGESALALLQETTPDVLITDLHMPGLDGLQLLQRAREETPDLVVVLLTGMAHVDTAVRAMQLGAEHYLTKPFTKDELLSAIETHIGR